MDKSLYKIIIQAYCYLLFLLFVLYQEYLTYSILLYNTLFFLIISSVIFHIFNICKTDKFTYASYITYVRIILVIILFSVTISSYLSALLFSVFYKENLFLIIPFMVLLLDWFDGFFARYLNETSKFGAIFDQETDAFLLLILTLSLYLNHNVPITIFLIPSYRYVFLILGLHFKWLKNTLPESYLRKVICSITILLLIICHMQSLSINHVQIISILAFLMITFSFTKDIIWLYGSKKYANS
jgi:phosphatidylglycerophosphate synthase